MSRQSRAYDFDALIEAEPAPDPIPSVPARQWYLIRQESGQLVYKFFGDDGKWHARRVPKRIVLKPDAVEWVVEVVYGLHQPRLDARENRLLSLINGTDNAGERAAAEQALTKLRAKKETR